MQPQFTPKDIERLWSYVDRNGGPTACWPWCGHLNGSGYGRINIGGRSMLVHRVVYLLEVGPIPDGYCICHHCDNRPCCNPACLFAGTVADNNRDRDQKGRHGYHGLKGERHHRAKLTEDDVRALRAMYVPRKVTIDDVAAAFNISRANAHAIITRALWSHIE